MADSARLGGRTVLVTGATGIAAAGARRFAAEAASVGIVSRDTAASETLVASIRSSGGRAAWRTADLSEETAAVDVVAELARELGRFDGLFAVAGGSGRRFGDGPLHEMPLEGWTETLDINLLPAFLATREIVRGMLAAAVTEGPARNAIVLVTSVLASHPSPRLFATHAYAAAKGGEDALVRTTAAYYAPRGIRINAVVPGLVDTPMSARAAADPATVRYAASKQPLAGGLLPASSIADAALFLLSDEARHITGQRLFVDGGWSVTEGSVPVV